MVLLIADAVAGNVKSVNVVGSPVSDTIKEVSGGRVIRTIPRDSLVDLSGPWLFTREALTRAVSGASQSLSRIESIVDMCRVAQLRVRVLPR